VSIRRFICLGLRLTSFRERPCVNRSKKNNDSKTDEADCSSINYLPPHSPAKFLLDSPSTSFTLVNITIVDMHRSERMSKIFCMHIQSYGSLQQLHIRIQRNGNNWQLTLAWCPHIYHTSRGPTLDSSSN
jgi:hypothetical protein